MAIALMVQLHLIWKEKGSDFTKNKVLKRRSACGETVQPANYTLGKG